MSFKMELSSNQTCDKCGKSDLYDVIIFTQSTRERTHQIIIHTSCLKAGVSKLIKKAGERLQKTASSDIYRDA